MKKQKRSLADETTGGNNARTNNTTRRSKNLASADSFWAKELDEKIGHATKDQVANLAKNMFRELWKTAGEEAAVAVTSPFRKTIQADKKRNQNMDGKWKFEKGELNIEKGMKEASCYYDCNEVYDLQLTSSIAENPLVYEGSIDSWGCCSDSFDATLRITYDPDSDTIAGDLAVEPCRNVEYGPDDAFGGEGSFTATRTKW